MANFAAPDGTSLHEVVWPASGQNAKGTVVLLHGYGEHILRYEHVAKALNAVGFEVRGLDLRGHGQSGGHRGFCLRFSEYLDDLHAFLERARASASGPLFIVAHSFGALVTTEYLLTRKPSNLTGVVLSSPFFKLKLDVPKVKVIAGRMMSRIYPKLGLPSGLKGADVSRDPEIAAAYDRDPLNNKSATARWFTETSAVQDTLLARGSDLSGWKLPTLFLVGAADKIADAQRAEEVFGRLGAPGQIDKTLRMLTGQYHEVFNEPAAEREKTLAELTGWLDAHCAQAGKLRAEGA
jgi:alpha-beta hydrolase superfamily lysophospholipase